MSSSSSSDKRKSDSNHRGDEGTGKKLRTESHYTIGSDDELPEESIENRLSWRTPEDPFADWKIVIVVKKTGKAETKEFTYNAHRCILAAGPRRSEYFVRLFENDGNFSEAQDKTSRIELSVLQAEAFPDLLDYIYSTGQTFSFNTDTATALYSISKYFGVARLQNEAKQFCLQDMKHVKRCGTYYGHATILQEESILEPAAQFCRENIKNIACASRLLSVRNPQFWLDLMEDHAKKNTISSLCYSLSNRIATYCNKHAAVMSPGVFLQLTDERYLLENCISPIAAVCLLDGERRIIGSNNDEQQGGGELSSLQIRCINAIAHGQKEHLRKLSQDWIQAKLKQLSPLVLYEIIARGFIPPPRA